MRMRQNATIRDNSGRKSHGNVKYAIISHGETKHIECEQSAQEVQEIKEVCK